MTLFDVSALDPAPGVTLDDVAILCACAEPTIVDRTCTVCHRPNLAALLAWKATWCACPVPDNQIAVSAGEPIEGRSCRRCGGSVRSALLR